MEYLQQDSIITSFYRIIMPSVIRERRLVLPQNFVDEYGDELSSKVKLAVPDGASWKVRLEKSGDLLYLHDDWGSFMEHYSIRFGYFLLFKFKENSEFDVHIFDLTATEIEYPLGCNSTDMTHANADAVCILEYDDNAESKEEKEALSAAKMYKTNKPSFIVKLSDNNVRGKYLYVPQPFRKEHMHVYPEFIRLVDSNDVEWCVRLCRHGKHLNIGRGWLEFVKKKGLKRGDVCVFELIKTNAILKVSIFHAKRPKTRVNYVERQ